MFALDFYLTLRHICVLTFDKFLCSTGNVFANYGACTGGFDRVMADNFNNEDGNHPVHLSNSILENVDVESKIVISRPSLGYLLLIS